MKRPNKKSDETENKDPANEITADVFRSSRIKEGVVGAAMVFQYRRASRSVRDLYFR